MGADHRLVTRGFGERFDFGGMRPKRRPFFRRRKEYYLNIFTPISKNNYHEINLYSPLEIQRSDNILIIASLLKYSEKGMGILTNIDYSLLNRVLDAI